MRNGFYPFAIVGFPFSQIGGAVQLPKHLYYPLGVILCWSLITARSSGSYLERPEPGAVSSLLR